MCLLIVWLEEHQQKLLSIMISSYKELKFYIKADEIMNDFGQPWYKTVAHINIRRKWMRIYRITEWLFNCKKQHKWMMLPYLYYSRKLVCLIMFALLMETLVSSHLGPSCEP